MKMREANISDFRGLLFEVGRINGSEGARAMGAGAEKVRGFSKFIISFSIINISLNI